MAKKTAVVELKPLEMATFTVNVRGITPLIHNKYSDEKAAEMRERYESGTKVKKKNEAKLKSSLHDELAQKVHKFSDGSVGFPAAGFQKGIVEVSTHFEGLTKKLVKTVQIVGGEYNLVHIAYDEVVVNEARCRRSEQNRAPYTAFRPEFRGWSCELEVRYDPTLIAPGTIVNLLNVAGTHQGIGDWRPEHEGPYGRYEVVGSSDMNEEAKGK